MRYATQADACGMRLHDERIVRAARPSIHMTKVIANGDWLLPAWIDIESRGVNIHPWRAAIVTRFAWPICIGCLT